MPFKYELTWMPHARRWRKRYRGATYYLKTICGGKRDRGGYLAALEEWNRLKCFLDGLGPSPYTDDGVLIPVDAVAFSERIVTSPNSQVKSLPTSERLPVQIYCQKWLSARRKEAERGNLSLKQWSEDSAKLKVFQSFLASASVDYVDQIDARVLDDFRNEQCCGLAQKRKISQLVFFRINNASKRFISTKRLASSTLRLRRNGENLQVLS